MESKDGGARPFFLLVFRPIHLPAPFSYQIRSTLSYQSSPEPDLSIPPGSMTPITHSYLVLAAVVT